MLSGRIMFLLCAFSGKLAAESAWREPHLDYSHYLRRSIPEIREVSTGRSALSSARDFGSAELRETTRWERGELQSRFDQLRDRPVINFEGRDRIPSWRYPDDGCFARAGALNRSAFQSFLPVPGKVFAFGNLRVETSHSPRGFVSWWYHVAPVVQSGGEHYVLDPAIEERRPLPLREWLARMGEPEKMQVAICAAGTYSPSDSCSRDTDGLELASLNSLRRYLKLEWERLRSLGMDPDREL